VSVEDPVPTVAILELALLDVLVVAAVVVLAEDVAVPLDDVAADETGASADDVAVLVDEEVAPLRGESLPELLAEPASQPLRSAQPQQRINNPENRGRENAISPYLQGWWG